MERRAAGNIAKYVPDPEGADESCGGSLRAVECEGSSAADVRAVEYTDDEGSGGSRKTALPAYVRAVECTDDGSGAADVRAVECTDAGAGG